MQHHLCPTCHSTIPENAPGGFCPVCLLRDADEPPASGPAAPSLAAITAAFPQLDEISLIGQGGMGFVYRARQPKLDRSIALKILSPALSGDPAFAERFAREARTLGKLQHPNIVTVFEHGESGGFFYLMMEYVDGVNLRQAMRAGRFTPAQALTIVPGICDALQYAHEQGVWHRDIKPENILLDREGRVKIADFGIARIIGDPRRDFTLTMTGNALGSAAYMAPEQHEKPHDVDHRADIYSLGVVIYEMLTGELPLGRFPSPSQRAAVDERIDEIVLRTLEKERELRQQSATEVKTGMHRAMQAEEPKKKTSSSASGGSFPSFPSSIGLWIGGIAALIAGTFTSPLITGLGLVCATLGLIACFMILWKIKQGTHSTEHRMPLLALVFWPVVLGLALLASATWFSTFKRGVFDNNAVPFAVYGFALLAIAAPWITGRLLWILFGKGPETTDPHKLGITPLAVAMLLIFFSSGLVKWIMERETTYESYRSKVIQLYGDIKWPDDESLVRQALMTSLGEQESHYRYDILGPGDSKITTRLRDVGSPFVLLETTLKDDKRTQISQKHFNAIAERLKTSLPRRISVNGGAGGAWGAGDSDAPSEIYQGYRNTRPWNFALMVVPALIVLLSVASRRALSWSLPIVAVVVAVCVAHSPRFQLPAALPPSIDGLAPLAPLPAPEYDFSTTRDAMVSMIKAAKKGDVENFKRGLSSKLREMTDANTTDIEEAMRNMVKFTYDGQISQEGDDASVNLINQTSKTLHAVPMIREGGEWKVHQIVQAPAPPRRAIVLPPGPVLQRPPVVPSVSPEEVFRKAVAAANESNGEEFAKLMKMPGIYSGPLAMYSQDNRIPTGVHGKKTLELMELFIGEIEQVKVVSIESKRLPSITFVGNGFYGEFSPIVYATIRKGDGTLTRLVVWLMNDNGSWAGSALWFPDYRASSRVAFKPEKGDAATILKTHLGTNTDFRAVENKPNEFEVFGFDKDPDTARGNAGWQVERLRLSLEKFDLSKYLKVIAPAAKPETPYMGENEPLFQSEKP